MPNPAFRRARPDDTFWAARRVMAFTDEMIRAAVRTGQYSDPAAEKHIADTLIARRDAIGRAWLTDVNPVIDPVLDASGTLSFRNAAVVAGVAKAPASYEVAWFAFDNGTGTATPIGQPVASAGEQASAPSGVPAGAGVIRARGYQGRQSAASVVGDSRARVLPAHRCGLEAGRVRAAARRSAPLSSEGRMRISRNWIAVAFLLCSFPDPAAVHAAGSLQSSQPVTAGRVVVDHHDARGRRPRARRAGGAPRTGRRAWSSPGA